MDHLIYPGILECCEYTNDMYWKSIFEQLAYGKTPYGVYIFKEFLCCNYKNKEFSYKIDTEEKEPEILFNEIYELFSNKLGLFSEKEKLKCFDDIEKSSNVVCDNWSSIKKKNHKTIFIEHYIVKMKEKYELSDAQIKTLYNVIILGQMLHTITGDDIQYKDGVIKKIEHIDFKKGKVIYQKDFII